MKTLLIGLLLFCSLSLSLYSQADAKRTFFPSFWITNGKALDLYVTNVLQIALSESDDYYIAPSHQPYEEPSEAIKTLKKNTRLHVSWGMAEHQTEDIIYVPVPIFRGMMSSRIALINENNPQLMQHIATVDELKKIQAIQAKTWPYV